MAAGSRPAPDRLYPGTVRPSSSARARSFLGAVCLLAFYYSGRALRVRDGTAERARVGPCAADDPAPLDALRPWPTHEDCLLRARDSGSRSATSVVGLLGSALPRGGRARQYFFKARSPGRATTCSSRAAHRTRRARHLHPGARARLRPWRRLLVVLGPARRARTTRGGRWGSRAETERAALERRAARRTADVPLSRPASRGGAHGRGAVDAEVLDLDRSTARFRGRRAPRLDGEHGERSRRRR